MTDGEETESLAEAQRRRREGEHAIRQSLARAREPESDPLKESPVVALGQRNGQYYFIAASGELRVLGARDMTAPGHLLSLFDGDRQWLANAFPRKNSEGETTGDFVTKTAAAALMRRCAAAGLWNEDTPVRGVGVWAAGADVVAHVGDALIVQGLGSALVASLLGATGKGRYIRQRRPLSHQRNSRQESTTRSAFFARSGFGLLSPARQR